MKYFLDTEFIEDGKTIDLISIGIVREDGANYYAQNLGCDFSKASEWVQQNVLPHLDDFDLTTNRPIIVNGSWQSKDQIRDEILAFVGDDSIPKFWAYYADYDWVVLCQLFGTMMDLPKGWPMFCRDLKQLANLFKPINLNELAINIEEHNALADAEWEMNVFYALYERFKFNQMSVGVVFDV